MPIDLEHTLQALPSFPSSHVTFYTRHKQRHYYAVLITSCTGYLLHILENSIKTEGCGVLHYFSKTTSITINYYIKKVMSVCILSTVHYVMAQWITLYFSLHVTALVWNNVYHID